MFSMTGKELMLYILVNDLENEVVISDGVFAGIMSAEEAASKFNVGVSTVLTWYQLQMLPGFKIGDSVFILKNADNPRNKNNQGVDCNG